MQQHLTGRWQPPETGAQKKTVAAAAAAAAVDVVAIPTLVVAVVEIEDATGVPVTIIKTGIEFDEIVDRRGYIFHDNRYKKNRAFGAGKEIFDEGKNV